MSAYPGLIGKQLGLTRSISGMAIDDGWLTRLSLQEKASQIGGNEHEQD
jgi:hypothetical protein